MLGRFGGRRLALLFAGALVGAAAACSLLVDTSGLSGASRDAAVGSDTGGTEGGPLDGSGTDGGMPQPPCNDPGLQPGAPWPMLSGCATHAGRSDKTGPQTAKPPKWKVQLDPGSDTCSPAVVGSDGTIYVGVEDDMVGNVAFNPDGTLAWRSTVPNNSAGAAIGANSTLYAGASRGFAAMDLGGGVRWQLPVLGGQVDCAPTVGPDGTVYVGVDGAPDGGSGGRVLALAPDGGTLWSFTTVGSVETSPALEADGTVIVGGGDNNVYALHPDGGVAWTYATGGGIRTPALAGDGTIYVGSSDDVLYALTPKGALVWRFTQAAGSLGAPVVGYDGTIYVGSADTYLYAVTPGPSGGALRWRFKTGGRIPGQATVAADGTIYVVSDDGVVNAIGADGSAKWSYPIGACSCCGYADPALGTDGTLYVTGNDLDAGPGGAAVGYLYAFGP